MAKKKRFKAASTVSGRASRASKGKVRCSGAGKKASSVANDAGEALGREPLRASLDAVKQLQAIGALYAGKGNLQAVLGEIVETARTISGADFDDIQVLNADGSTLGLLHKGGFRIGGWIFGTRMQQPSTARAVRP